MANEMCAIAGVANYNDRAKAPTSRNFRKTEHFAFSWFGLCRPQLTSDGDAALMLNGPSISVRTVFIDSRWLSPGVDKETGCSMPGGDRKSVAGQKAGQKKTRGDLECLLRVGLSVKGQARYCIPGSVSSCRKSPMSIARRFNFL
jgi:hypothetical protein